MNLPLRATCLHLRAIGRTLDGVRPALVASFPTFRPELRDTLLIDLRATEALDEYQRTPIELLDRPEALRAPEGQAAVRGPTDRADRAG